MEHDWKVPNGWQSGYCRKCGCSSGGGHAHQPCPGSPHKQQK